MARPVAIFTGQWADLPLEVLAEKASSWGYDGLELACWGDHMDVFKAAEDLEYCAGQKAILNKHPCGFPLARRLRRLGHTCHVIAPSMIPRNRHLPRPRPKRQL